MSGGGSVAALGLGTAAVWGAADFAGGLSAKRASPAFVVVVAHGFSLVLLGIAALLLHPLSFGHALYGVLSGLFCGVGLIALYSALSQGSMGLSAALSGVLSALVPVVFSWFHEAHPAPRRLFGFGIVALAIWLVAYIPQGTSEPRSRPRGLGLAVVAGLCFGAMLIYMHLAAATGVLPQLVAMRIASTSVAALSGFILWASRGRKERAGLGFPTGRLLLLAMLAGVLDTSGNFLYLFASLLERLDVAAVLSSLYPAGTMLLAAWLLKERVSRSQTAGMALALAAVVLISI